MAEQPKPTITGKTLAQAAPKLPQMKNNPLTPDQIAMFSELRNLLDPNSQFYNPVTRYGAQLMQEQGQQISHWQTPLNVGGLTFLDRYLPSNEVESNMLKEAGLSPTSARGQIAVGPEAMSGKRKDVIPHELAHKALNALNIKRMDEEIVRQLMINNGLNIKENMQWLSAMTPSTDAEFVELLEGVTRFASQQAEEKLKKKGK